MSAGLGTQPAGGGPTAPPQNLSRLGSPSGVGGELPGRGGAGGKGGSSPGAAQGAPGDEATWPVLPERDPGGALSRAAGVTDERGG